MKKAWVLFILFQAFNNTYAQNTIGLPRIINYNIRDFQAGNQTWDIQQDDNGIMYFANGAGLLTFDGNQWRLYRLPNKTIVRSLFISQDQKIYVGGQDEFGYFEPDINGCLKYESLRNLIPKTYNQFADIWDIEPFGESLFFRATDRIFELNNQNIRVFPSDSEWRYIKRVGGKLIARIKYADCLNLKTRRGSPYAENHLIRILFQVWFPSGRTAF